jgi:hypothetical protein
MRHKMTETSENKNPVRDYFKNADRENTHRWQHDLYSLIPSSHYHYLSTVDGPDGFTYLGICPSSDINKVQTFDAIIRAAKENLLGIAFFDDLNWRGKRPLVTLGYGSVWAFTEYGQLAGTTQQYNEFEKALNINPDNPYDAWVDPENDEIQIGDPSEELLPFYIRKLITEQLSIHFPAVTPDFKIYEQLGLALKMSLCITIDPNHPVENFDQQLIDKLVWLLPPYLPFMLR